MNNFIILDFGNTRIKVYSDNSKNIDNYYYSNINELIDLIHTFSINKIYYSTVNPSQSNLFINSLGIEAIDVSTLVDHWKIDFSEITGMGTDRKLGLIGARSIKDGALIVIDCGSANTINFLDNNDKCIGGYILPGLEIRVKGLDNLAQLDYYFPENTCFKNALNTEDAIKYGVLFDSAGGIKNLIAESSKLNKINYENVFLTGGNSKLIHGALQEMNFSVDLQDNLVLMGIKALIEEA